MEKNFQRQRSDCDNPVELPLPEAVLDGVGGFDAEREEDGETDVSAAENEFHDLVSTDTGHGTK